MGYISRLEWDTSHFGLKIGDYTSTEVSYNDLQQLQSEAKSENYDLVYLKCNEELKRELLSDNVIHADTRVVYSQSVRRDNIIKDRHVVSWLNHELDTQLMSLALQSGGCSRYFRDKRMPIHVFLTLYQEWITGSLNGTLATDVLVYTENDEICGMLTYRTHTDKVVIGLLCVDHNKSGKGIGSKLMQSFLSLFPEGTRIEVATQLENETACKFYEKNGFSKESVSNTYHLWTN